MGPRRPTARPGEGRPAEGEGRAGEGGLEALMRRVAKGEHAAFEEMYEQLAGQVYGLVLRVLRDPAQSEEVAQDVLVEVWRNAARYDPSKGSARTWVMTITHRRAVDRVRSAQASVNREERVARLDVRRPFDEVSDSVEKTLDFERLRRCLNGLTHLQRESVTFAYYDGYSYREVAELLKVPLATVKTRMRDGLIRMRDCLGVER